MTDPRDQEVKDQLGRLSDVTVLYPQHPPPRHPSVSHLINRGCKKRGREGYQDRPRSQPPGGGATGRGVVDLCEKVPEGDLPYCRGVTTITDARSCREQRDLSLVLVWEVILLEKTLGNSMVPKDNYGIVSVHGVSVEVH